jgi:hypothetical protein
MIYVSYEGPGNTADYISQMWGEVRRDFPRMSAGKVFFVNERRSYSRVALTFSLKRKSFDEKVKKISAIPIDINTFDMANAMQPVIRKWYENGGQDWYFTYGYFSKRSDTMATYQDLLKELKKDNPDIKEGNIVVSVTGNVRKRVLLSFSRNKAKCRLDDIQGKYTKRQ